ncbi:MAG: hypothetical protein NZ898_14600 [Myxococcota bacterium]|nr:hypothetical protein [Myxococcota bacterium]MDW8362999.1 hypothetical protein [Myxococcales bacterium]
MNLRERLRSGDIDMAAVAAYLDELDPAARLEQIRALERGEQARLFEAASGFRPIDLDFFVPHDRLPLVEVVHHGKNSLPVFTRFAKVMCRPPAGQGEPETLWGYNRSGAFLETVVGPGYFVVRRADRAGEVDIDYFAVPPGKPEGWPPIVGNERRLSRFVYHHTRDRMRGVSRHVSVGRASRDGRPMDAWFVLCRED